MIRMNPFRAESKSWGFGLYWSFFCALGHIVIINDRVFFRNLPWNTNKRIGSKTYWGGNYYWPEGWK